VKPREQSHDRNHDVFIMLKMTLNECLLGVLYVESTAVENAFASKVKSASLLAHLLSSAIHNAFLVHQLKVIQRELVQANNSRTSFLSNVSHELRTPLHGIIATVCLFHAFLPICDR
jgi:K+-sensing histidine kinase KdpD